MIGKVVILNLHCEKVESKKREKTMFGQRVVQSIRSTFSFFVPPF